MAREVKLPTLGENVAGGDVVEVKVKPGDVVKEGQALLEVEAEKSSVEVPSPFAGRVSQVVIKKGDKVKTGQTLILFEGEGAATKPAAKPAPEKPAEKKPEADKTTSMKTERPDSVPATSPAAVETRSEAPAAATRQSTAPPPPATWTPPAGPTHENGDEGAVVPAGPATRRLAQEWGVELRHVTGSGPKGRVNQDDVKQYVRRVVSGGGSIAAPPPLPNFEQWGAVEYKPLDAVRRKTAEHMSTSWNNVAHVTHDDLADITEVENFRKQQEGKGPKLTVTAFAIKAAVIALKQFPKFNASLDLNEDRLVFKKYYHVGVAVDTDRGLLVPVVRDVDKKTLNEIANDLAAVAEKARQKKLTADDMRGGTFTISNLGGIGGTRFSPIVNYPEVAILGLARSRMQPVFKEGQWVPRPLLPLSLSYDHRVIDGADAARFTRRLAELIENPMLMLL